MIKDTFVEFFEIFWGNTSSNNLELYIAFVVTILLLYTLFKGGRRR